MNITGVIQWNETRNAKISAYFQAQTARLSKTNTSLRVFSVKVGSSLTTNCTISVWNEFWEQNISKATLNSSLNVLVRIAK